MSMITLRVIAGSDRGRVFTELSTPVTIGREEGNSIQLNDERVSRFHVKIQEDNDRIVLTDLASTNGTKVNGEEIQLRILRYGDTISVGRSTLLFGSRDEIAQRLHQLRVQHQDGEGTLSPEEYERLQAKSSLDFELSWGDDADLQATLHALEPPELPDRMTPGQAAQLAEILEYLHIRLRNLIQTARVDGQEGRVTIDYRRWQSLLDLQSRLAEYMRHVAEPGAS
jgi:pSer/pThr/pTyr-binding forkhead associated (FHA) protein